MKLPVKNGLNCFDITACAIYDGKDHWLGLSCSFQLPTCVSSLIQDKEADLDLGQAMRLSGLTQKFEVGKEEGSIGILTKGRVSRRDYTEQAIRMAFIPFQNRDAYGMNKQVKADPENHYASSNVTPPPTKHAYHAARSTAIGL